MSATPTNAKLRMPGEGTGLGVSKPTQPPASYHAPGRETLQALLAFSSLHDQIRRRRSRGRTTADRSTADRSTGLAEQFVPDEIFQLISERALAITGADGVAIALSNGEQVLCRGAAGEMAPDVGVPLDPTSGFSGACFRTGLIVRCDDTEKDPRVDQAACRRIGVRSMVAVPLLTEQGVVGLIAGFCREIHGVSDGDIRSLSLLAELTLAALQPEEPYPASKDSRVSEVKGQREGAVHELPGWPDTRRAAAESDSDEVQETTLPNLENLRNTLSRVTEEREAANAALLASQESVQRPFAGIDESGNKKRWLAIILILICLALAGLGLWWWRSKAFSVPPKQVEAAPQVGGIPAPQPDTEPVPEAAKETPTGEIAGVRHWSSADSSTVAIDLKEQVQYEAHRLSNPERIYFDLRGTTLAPGIPGTIEVGDPLLSRIRVAQASSDLTRVVLETKNNPAFSVKLETNPYRLLIEVHAAAAKPKTSAKVDLFAAPDTDQSKRVSTTPEQGTWLAPSDPSSDSETAAARTVPHTFRIVLDAGHGGWDMGTVGRRGLLEKDLVLDIVARLGKLVSDRLGAEVIYTRRDDTYVPLEKRTEIANVAQADMFLSVHANYSNSPTARGVETYYTTNYSSAHARVPDNDTPEALNVEWLNSDTREKAQQSRSFANDVQQALYHNLAAKNPALRNRGVKEASYVVLTGTTMPAILAEVSFVSSPEDETKLESADYRQKIAEGVFKGIAAYAETQRRVNVASASTATGGQ